MGDSCNVGVAQSVDATSPKRGGETWLTVSMPGLTQALTLNRVVVSSILGAWGKLGISEEEWYELNEKDQEAMIRDIVFDRVDWGFMVEDKMPPE